MNRTVFSNVIGIILSYHLKKLPLPVQGTGYLLIAIGLMEWTGSIHKSKVHLILSN
jgi:hypothetical protein